MPTESGRRVLVVEDELLVALDLEKTVREFGAEPVGPAFTLEVGLALAKDAALAGALLDLNVAGKSVLPIARTLKDRGIPIAMVTGYEPELARIAHLEGVPWIRKPFSDQDIRDVLAAWLERAPH